MGLITVMIMLCVGMLMVTTPAIVNQASWEMAFTVVSHVLFHY